MTYYDTEEFWLKRAEETRTLAERMSKPEIGQKMRCVAEDYEQLARLAKERAAIMARLNLQAEELEESPNTKTLAGPARQERPE